MMFILAYCLFLALLRSVVWLDVYLGVWLLSWFYFVGFACHGLFVWLIYFAYLLMIVYCVLDLCLFYCFTRLNFLMLVAFTITLNELCALGLIDVWVTVLGLLFGFVNFGTGVGSLIVCVLFINVACFVLDKWLLDMLVLRCALLVYLIEFTVCLLCFVLANLYVCWFVVGCYLLFVIAVWFICFVWLFFWFGLIIGLLFDLVLLLNLNICCVIVCDVWILLYSCLLLLLDSFALCLCLLFVLRLIVSYFCLLWWFIFDWR